MLVETTHLTQVQQPTIFHIYWKSYGQFSSRFSTKVQNFVCGPRCHFRSGKLPVLDLLTGQKSGFSPHRGDSLHRFRSNFAGPTGTSVRLAVQNFTSIGVEGWECGPKKYQKFPLFGKESPRKGDSRDQFLKYLGDIIRLTILHQCFKFHVIRITGYGVIAEKPRVGKLGHIFPCTLQEKPYVGSKNR